MKTQPVLSSPNNIMSTVPSSGPRKITLAYLHSGINIPTFALSVATTLGGSKFKKGIVMHEGVAGIELNDGSQTWIVPWANIKAYEVV